MQVCAEVSRSYIPGAIAYKTGNGLYQMMLLPLPCPCVKCFGFGVSSGEESGKDI
jgi:hypothetical protein